MENKDKLIAHLEMLRKSVTNLNKQIRDLSNELGLIPEDYRYKITDITRMDDYTVRSRNILMAYKRDYKGTYIDEIDIRNLAKIRNCGSKSINEVISIIDKYTTN